MNIELQSFGLAMLLILFIIMLRDKNLNLSMNRRFRIATISCIASLVMDIVSVVAIVYATEGLFPRNATEIICKIYLVLLINVGYRGFLYVATEFLREETHAFFRRSYSVLFGMAVAAILIMPIDYFSEGRVVYSFGPSTLAAYIFAFISFASIILFVYWDKEGTSKRRRRIILIWQVCWLLASIVQFFKADLLVVSFAAAAGIMLIYSELENPNELIDRTTGQFNYLALQKKVEDYYHRGKSFSALHVAVDYGAGELDLELLRTALRRVANFFDTKDDYVFREADNDLVIIYENEKALERGYERADRELEGVVDLPIRFSYTLIPDNSIFKTAEEFLQFQHYNRNKATEQMRIVKAEQAEEMRALFEKREQIEWALANNGVEVYFQPIYNIAKKKFTAAEALLRIKDHKGDVIMPGRFIPIAEESGLIVPLGREVFRQVCELLAEGEVQKLGIKTLTVNLSMVQFSDEQPAKFVQEMTAEYGIDPSQVEFEITETADSALQQNVLKNMETLIDAGFNFALDDFGTGRSNLDYFVVMPISVIKFDYRFTHWYFDNERSREVMIGTMELIKRMGLPIVMEGVETKEELDAMTKLGASYIQGFYFTKPLPKDEFLNYLKEQQ